MQNCELTPRSLLDRLSQATDDTSWRRLVHLYEPFIKRWLCQAAIPESDAGDLSQDVFTVLVKDLPSFRHNGRAGAFRAWLRQVVVNRIRGYWRNRGSEPQAATATLDSLANPDSGLSGEWDREHDAYVARRLIEMLEGEFAPQRWTAFRRQVMDGAKASDVAQELGMTVNAVLIAKSRVLRRLREEASGILELT